ncbi:SDR family NAD(P)-dependent oxidoreductase [Actinophytocola sp.]|uniref:SDR family NAD(P)-dependent oxidoreductase n=1 Tax=Actinophytocola sp. TaxID=1872138 RepID=UPI003D6C1AB3
MDLQLAGKRAVVTGASEGIGLATARVLAGEGAHVALVSRRADVLEREAKTIAAEYGVRAIAAPADLGDLAGCRHAMDTALAGLGGLDILVNNAGASVFATFEDIPDERWVADLELKLVGYARMTRLALAPLREAGGGRVVNVAGNAGKQPLTYHMPGGAANVGVLNLTKSVSMQVGPEGIFVNAVCPGPVRTTRYDKMIDRLAVDWGLTHEQAEARYVADLPLPYVPEPEEVAATIVFLASPRSAYVNGTAVTVDGGITRGI